MLGPFAGIQEPNPTARQRESRIGYAKGDANAFADHQHLTRYMPPGAHRDVWQCTPCTRSYFIGLRSSRANQVLAWQPPIYVIFGAWKVLLSRSPCTNGRRNQ